MASMFHLSARRNIGGHERVIEGSGNTVHLALAVAAGYTAAATAAGGRVTGAANPALIVVPCAVVGAVALLLPRTRA